ncbi:serine hydrolase [uncultured Nocardioides sp.]|uniref:serine hydrolase n=1 Tax=uncultured Nocardioides sp. TaxID=198441 RepID=UPI00263913FA|nr:serine hydrolase [uncultured Nocardioides sp.]
MTASHRLLREVASDLETAGLRGWYLVRDLLTGEEIGIDPDTQVPIASLVKIPLALSVLERMRTGELDAADEVRVMPGATEVTGPVGVTKFRHPATIALGDLLYLAVSLSDTVAADALFERVPPREVDADLRSWGVHGFLVRHRVGELTETPLEAMVEVSAMAYALAAGGGTPGGGHRVPQLDVGHANAASARGCVDLLERIWVADGTLDESVSARVRSLMGDNVVQRQRLWPDFASDASTWSSKSGTLLNLRHEMGVVEHADGGLFAIAALTESSVAAAVQPAAEATMGRVARRLRDHLRR